MELMLIGIGFILTILGIINILLRWCCTDAEMISWFMFIGGIIITILGYIVAPLSEVTL